jgi:hypothetical protein
MKCSPNKLNCKRCRRDVVPVIKMAGQICPFCRIILEPVTIAEVKIENSQADSKRGE